MGRSPAEKRCGMIPSATSRMTTASTMFLYAPFAFTCVVCRLKWSR